MTDKSHPDSSAMTVTVLTSAFQIRGALHVLGALQTFLNDEQKPTISVFESDVLGIEPTNMAHMVQAETIINKRSAEVVMFEAIPPQGTLTLLPRAEALVMYLDKFAVSGRFYMGQDARVADFADSSKQQFLVLTEARVYPLTPVRQGLIYTAPLAVMHKTAIRFYHKQ